MAATGTALIASQPGTSWDTAWPQVTPNGVASQNLDLIQIKGEGDNVLLNVDHAGVVHNPASGATNGTRVGRFQTRLTGSPTTAQLFADAFSNPSLIDILQVITPASGSVAKYLDYLGVSH